MEENEKSSDSIIHISVDSIYRQIENHFTQKPNESTELHNHIYHWKDSNSNTIKENIQTLFQCQRNAEYTGVTENFYFWEDSD